jgi:hypothetical protein
MVGRWDDAINIRRLVRERNVKKNKGFSTIKVDEPLARTGSFFSSRQAPMGKAQSQAN